MKTEFVVLKPGDTDLLEQLAANDLVHEDGADSVESLLTYRVGCEGQQKRTFALINPETREVYAAIYGMFFTNPVRSPADIPGDVAAILSASCAPLQEKPTGMVFYSISALYKEDGKTLRLKGSGKMLLNALMEYADQGGLPKGIVRATLSPARCLLERYPFLASKMMCVGNVLPYMMAVHEAIWGDYYVWRTHMSCGAAMGDLKCNANAIGTRDDLEGAAMMANLIYPETSEERKKNIKAFHRARAGDGCKTDLLSSYLKSRLGMNLVVVAAALLWRRAKRARINYPNPSQQS